MDKGLEFRVALNKNNIKQIGDYTKNYNKVLCENAHGKIMVLPSSLMYGNIPGILSAVNKSEYFKSMAKLVHGDKYDYSKVHYTRKKDKIDIICDIHGLFCQTPDDHLNGKGCRICGIDLSKSKQRSTTIEFIKKAKVIHGDEYDYSKTKYISTYKNITITCKIHGDFEQSPSNHLSGKGCLLCFREIFGWSRSGFSEKTKGKTGILYIIECFNDNEDFIKIGITSQSIKERFNGRSLPYNYRIVNFLETSNKSYVWDLEKTLHRKLKKYKYKPIISFGGETECFNIECLNSKTLADLLKKD